MPSSSIPSSTLRIIYPKLSQIPGLPPTTSLKSHPLIRPKILSFSTIRFERLPRPAAASYSPQGAQAAPPVDAAQLPPSLQEIISLFQSVPDRDHKAKYRQLLHYGDKLPPLDPLQKTDENRVRGCVSQVWVHAFADPDDPRAVRFQADSDSALTKGLAALLVLGLSGSSPEVIARVPPEFVQLLGLRQSLTPSRNNGFLNMLRLMQRKALLLSNPGGDAGEEGLGLNGDGGSGGSSNPGTGNAIGVNGNKASTEEQGDASQPKEVSPVLNGSAAHSTASEITATASEQSDTAYRPDSAGDAPVASSGAETGGRAERIRERLQRALSPLELDIEDISYQHAGHAGVKGVSGGETHFNLRIISKEFEGKSLVKRHRLVYEQLQEELQSGLHALSIVAKTPAEVGLQ